MLLRLKLLGRGNPDDPYRVNLPTYTLIHGNISQGYAIVNVDENVHGQDEQDLKDEPHDDTTEGVLYHALSAGVQDKIHRHFDEHYHEHRGEFRIEHA